MQACQTIHAKGSKGQVDFLLLIVFLNNSTGAKVLVPLLECLLT